MSGRGFISVELPRKCEYCGKKRECRPYGESSKQICFKCMKSDPKLEAIANEKIRSYIFGEVDKYMGTYQFFCHWKRPGNTYKSVYLWSLAGLTEEQAQREIQQLMCRRWSVSTKYTFERVV